MLDKNKIIRAWKDVRFRNSLKDAERSSLPAHPSGWIELSDDDTASINGGSVNCTWDWNCGPSVTRQDCPSTKYPTCGGGSRPPACGGSNPCPI